MVVWARSFESTRHSLKTRPKFRSIPRTRTNRASPKWDLRSFLRCPTRPEKRNGSRELLHLLEVSCEGRTWSVSPYPKGPRRHSPRGERRLCSSYLDDAQ